MKKFTLLTLLVLLFSFSVDAETEHDAESYQLTAILKSGVRMGYHVTSHPTFRLAGDCIRLTSDLLSIDIPLADFDRFTFEPAKQPTGIDLPGELKVSLGHSEQLTCVLSPSDASSTLTWTSSNDEVAEVSSTGVVTAKQVGTATVTVQTSNGLQASCQVIVPEAQWRLYVWLNDGTFSAFDLSKHPEISLNGDRLVVNADATQLEYSVADVARITMADAAVFNPQDGLVVPVQAVAEADPMPRFRAGQLSLSNLPAGAHVRIYNGAGMLLHQAVADDRGQLSLSASRFGKGLLIVRTETSTFKILQQ